jgi:thiol-disulfide isomerase/thioredoxin
MKTSAMALCLWALLLCACSGDPPPPPGSAAGAALAAPGPRGEWVVINYWAEWCAPCIKEIPELNALDREYDDVTVLGVNFDGAAGEELRLQVETLGVTFPTLDADPGESMGLDRPQVLPTTLVIDPQGVLVDTLVGPQTLASLTAALGKAAP